MFLLLGEKKLVEVRLKRVFLFDFLLMGINVCPRHSTFELFCNSLSKHHRVNLLQEDTG